MVPANPGPPGKWPLKRRERERERERIPVEQRVCWWCRYEREGRGRRVVPARKLWDHIISAQIETGTPYMLYKDSCNRKSNQQNLGTITCSNLCTEIIEYCDKDEVILLLSCAKSHMLSASRRQPHLLHVSAVDRRQTWSMDKS